MALFFFQVELADEFFSEEAALTEDLNRHERDGVHGGGHAHAGGQGAAGRQGRRQGGSRQEEVAPIQELPQRSEPRQVSIGTLRRGAAE